jgi:hypothetical protein
MTSPFLVSLIISIGVIYSITRIPLSEFHYNPKFPLRNAILLLCLCLIIMSTFGTFMGLQDFFAVPLIVLLLLWFLALQKYLLPRFTHERFLTLFSICITLVTLKMYIHSMVTYGIMLFLGILHLGLYWNFYNQQRRLYKLFIWMHFIFSVLFLPGLIIQIHGIIMNPAYVTLHAFLHTIYLLSIIIPSLLSVTYVIWGSSETHFARIKPFVMASHHLNPLQVIPAIALPFVVYFYPTYAREQTIALISGYLLSISILTFIYRTSNNMIRNKSNSF